MVPCVKPVFDLPCRRLFKLDREQYVVVCDQRTKDSVFRKSWNFDLAGCNVLGLNTNSKMKDILKHGVLGSFSEHDDSIVWWSSKKPMMMVFCDPNSVSGCIFCYRCPVDSGSKQESLHVLV